MTTPGEIVIELRVEHDALSSLVHGLDAEILERPSYASEWTIAQVLSHLGSGAEINLSNLHAALRGTEPIPKDAYRDLWKRWDDMGPVDQAVGFQRWHGELVAVFEEASWETLKDLEVPTAMGMLSGAAVIGMRFREATVHAWDVAAGLDRAATIRSAAAGILADQAPEMIGRLADPSAASTLDLDMVSIVGRDPDRRFLLQLDPIVLRADAHPDDDRHAVLRLPTESFVRLIYGRVDDDDLGPTIDEDPDGLIERLRRVFRGL